MKYFILHCALGTKCRGPYAIEGPSDFLTGLTRLTRFEESFGLANEPSLKNNPVNLVNPV